VVRVRVDQLVALHVPQTHGLVIGGARNHAGVEGELSLANPIGVAFKGLEEFALSDRPHLDRLII
jgi:hypothetical protein